ncbi:MAG: alpha/beta fold hydrolase [Candidatus Hodarchaeota archaeon]
MDCRLKNITIYYEIHGEGYPILMLHGFFPDHRLLKGCMEPIFNERPNFKRIYLDLPGMGKTKGESWIQNSDHFLNIVIQFIDNIIPNQNFLIIGDSYGAYLARGLLYKKFDFVDGICLICPLIEPNPSKRKLPKFITIIEDQDLIAKIEPSEVADFVDSIVVQTPRVWERYKNEVLSGIKDKDLEFLTKIFEEGYPFSFNVDKLIKQFDKPTLFLLGRQDNTVGYQDAWKIIESYTRATFSVLDKAGHNLQIEQENLFNSLINEWLDRVEENLI